MYRRIVAVAAGLCFVLAGCGEPPRAGQPPAQQDALTQTTAVPTEKTWAEINASATSDPQEGGTGDGATSTASEPTHTAAPSGVSSGGDDPYADGPPEMPELAREHTEEGAAAFAEYYMELVNYTGLHPEVGVLEALAGEECKTCRNYENNVKYFIENAVRTDKAPISIKSSRAVDFAEYHKAFLDIEVLAYSTISGDGAVHDFYEETEVTFIFTLSPADPWVVEEIQGRR